MCCSHTHTAQEQGTHLVAAAAAVPLRLPRAIEARTAHSADVETEHREGHHVQAVHGCCWCWRVRWDRTAAAVLLRLAAVLLVCRLAAVLLVCCCQFTMPEGLPASAVCAVRGLPQGAAALLLTAAAVAATTCATTCAPAWCQLDADTTVTHQSPSHPHMLLSHRAHLFSLLNNTN